MPPKKKASHKASPQKTAPSWQKPMPDEQFNLMKDILAAPSPIGLEAAMSYGVLKPYFESFIPQDWAIHSFKGNAGLVVDTHPGDSQRTSVMIIGHADKIRMQVRRIDEKGKIWVDTESFLPCTLIGHEVSLFCQDPQQLGHYKRIDGGTIEALGAIHFSAAAQRTGDKGIRPEMIYLELQTHGDDRKKALEDLGIRPGDPIILNRPIRKGFSPNSFYGAYLDNGLGCFVVSQIAKILAKDPLKNLRILYTIATHEEIGRFGSMAAAGEFRPDILIGSDVNHDFDAAPGIEDKRMAPLAMGKGFTLTYGSITSSYLNTLIEKACRQADIPYQIDFAGRDTGTDAMAASLTGFDAASTSIGFPIRNMHTISETGHTADVLSAIAGMVASFRSMDNMHKGKGITREDLRGGHPRLDESKELHHS